MASVCLSGSGPLLPEVKKVPDFNSWPPLSQGMHLLTVYSLLLGLWGAAVNSEKIICYSEHVNT